MTVELTQKLTELAKFTNQRIESRQKRVATGYEIIEYYTGLGLSALEMGGGYSGRTDGRQITGSGEDVVIDNRNPQITLVVSRAVAASKAAYALHQIMDGGNVNYSPEKHASFDQARKSIAYLLGIKLLT